MLLDSDGDNRPSAGTPAGNPARARGRGGHMLMQGFPPPLEQRVTLANWQTPPYNRWSFQHVR